MAEYINREALIDFCKKIIHDRWNETTAPVSWSHAYADFIDDINNQPAADVAPVKHGKWTTIDGISRCSECGYIPLYDNAIDDLFYSDYCPNCGARMEV